MYIAIDIGGTNARIAFSKKNDSSLFVVEKFVLDHNMETDFKKILEIIDKHSFKKIIKAISVGIAGTLNDKKSELIGSNHLPEWLNVKVPEILAKRYNCPVWMDNDVVMAAFSEINNENFQDKNYIYLAWGTGIGGAQFKKEKNRFIIQKINHSIYLKEFELKCGGKSIQKRFNKSIIDFKEKEWNDITTNFEENIIKLSDMLNGKTFILTGGVAYKQKDRLKNVINKLKEKSIDLKMSKFGEDAGLYGALAFVDYHR